MSELLDKQVNAQKIEIEKTFGIHASSHKPTKRCDENESRNKEKWHVSKVFLMEGRCMWKSSMIDCKVGDC